MALIGFLMLVGTAGASDMATIGAVQETVQIIIGLTLFIIGARKYIK